MPTNRNRVEEYLQKLQTNPEELPSQGVFPKVHQGSEAPKTTELFKMQELIASSLDKPGQPED